MLNGCIAVAWEAEDFTAVLAVQWLEFDVKLELPSADNVELDKTVRIVERKQQLNRHEYTVSWLASVPNRNRQGLEQAKKKFILVQQNDLAMCNLRDVDTG
jgi:hypothetical protein